MELMVLNDQGKKFALVLDLNGDMLNNSIIAMNIWLERFAINYIFSTSPCPHIVIDAGFYVNDIDNFQRSLEIALNDISEFTIHGRGLGVFVAATPVVHIRWFVDEKFNKFRCQISNCLAGLQNQGVISDYRSDLNWVAKTTLGYEDTRYDKLSEIISSVKGINFKRSMDAENLSLYEYSRMEGQKQLATLKLKS